MEMHVGEMEGLSTAEMRAGFSGEAVRDLADLLNVSISKSARLELKLAGGLPPIRADAVQVQQVIMNLITNASEAIGSECGKRDRRGRCSQRQRGYSGLTVST